MKNNKWYYRVDLESKAILDYSQIPDVWNNCTGLSSSDDNTLANLSWTGYNQGFLSKEAAIEFGVASSEFDRMATLVLEIRKAALRKKRDILITQSDKAVMPDRWESYSAEKKAGIASYRQQLRDITNIDSVENIDNVTWPSLPQGLEYLVDYQ